MERASDRARPLPGGQRRRRPDPAARRTLRQQRGAEATRNADLAGVARPDLTDRQALDLWMSTPFHALGILRPDLRRVGYGSWSESDGSAVQSAAVLDVVRGLAPGGGDAQRPVMWPGPGAVVPLTSYAGPEAPDPLSSCAGYQAPAGLPILVLLPDDAGAGAATVDVDDERVEACVVSESTYVNVDAGAQALGRALLGADHAVVIIPRLPLPDAAEVAVSLQAGPTSLAWTFRTGTTTEAILPAHPLA